MSLEAADEHLLVLFAEVAKSVLKKRNKRNSLEYSRVYLTVMEG